MIFEPSDFWQFFGIFYKFFIGILSVCQYLWHKFQIYTCTWCLNSKFEYLFLIGKICDQFNHAEI